MYPLQIFERMHETEAITLSGLCCVSSAGLLSFVSESHKSFFESDISLRTQLECSLVLPGEASGTKQRSCVLS